MATTTAPDYAAVVQQYMDSCTTLDAMERTANEINRKALAEWARLQGLPGNLARMPKPELAKLVADTAFVLRADAPQAPAAEVPEATLPQADQPEPPEAPMAGTIEAIKAEKPAKAPKAKAKGAGTPRATWMPGYAEALAAKKAKARPDAYPVKLTEAERVAYIQALLAEQPDATMGQAMEVAAWVEGHTMTRQGWARSWATATAVQGPEVPEAEEGTAGLSAAEAAELAATDAEAQA